MTREPERSLRAGTGAGVVRFLLYVAIILSPLGLAVATQPKTDHPFVQEVAKSLALIAYAMVALQPVITARYRWLERPFGLDALLVFHRWMGIVAGSLLLAHPVLYAAGGSWELLLGFSHGWEIGVGKVAFLAIVALLFTSLARRAVSLDFETWRGIHNGLALSVLVLGFAHSIVAGGDMTEWPMRIVWIALFSVGLGSYLYHSLFVRRRLRRDAFEVVRVTRETDDVWSLEMKPRRPALGIDHLPGQFLFLTLHRESGPIEEHPFTIASSPAPSGRVVTTIKESGDFTRAIGETAVGDGASVAGPFGRFSHLLHPEAEDIVFIAGGVGVTPMLSMLRHMRETGDNRSVLLLYGNRRERDIVARDELEEMARGGVPSLRVVHVLSRAGDDWNGESGHIDRACVEKHCAGELAGKGFYVSGPQAMISEVAAQLRAAGVPARAIRVERFAL